MRDFTAIVHFLESSLRASSVSRACGKSCHPAWCNFLFKVPAVFTAGYLLLKVNIIIQQNVILEWNFQKLCCIQLALRKIYINDFCKTVFRRQFFCHRPQFCCWRDLWTGWSLRTFSANSCKKLRTPSYWEFRTSVSCRRSQIVQRCISRWNWTLLPSSQPWERKCLWYMNNKGTFLFLIFWYASL